MNGLIQNSAYFGVTLSLLLYFLGTRLKQRYKKAVFNPLLIAVVLTIAFLIVFRIDYDSYNMSAKYLSWLLTPATICLAIPLYEQFELLKKNYAAVLAGILAGTLTSLIAVAALALMFGLSHSEYVTFLPKSVTAAIGMPISEELGGYPSLTAAVIVITGIIGNTIAEGFLKLLKITEPVAKGIAIGTSSHAIGTGKAVEMGEVEGAFSGLSIAVAGILTVIGANVFANFI